MIKNNEKIRVAQIMGKMLGGGVESVVMNYYRHIDKSKIQFDFICDEDSTNIPYKEIEALGGKVILIPKYQKIVKYHKELKRILKENNYKIIHSHINTLSIFPLFAAWCTKVPIRIAHSHSTTNKKEKKKNLLKQILRPLNKLFATEYMACTEHSGRWLFGNRLYDMGKVYLLNNAIELDKFAYNEKIRKEKRKELGIDDETVVIGHVGRFVEQKNHEFLIGIFSEYHKKNANSLLLLVGQGPLMEKIKEKVKNLDIQKSVRFLGQRNDTSELYQAFDVFLFPSLYEGLGIVSIEAQVSGCKCVASTEVPKVSKISENIVFLDLNDDMKLWTSAIELNKIRKEVVKEARDNGYDITLEAKELENKYKSLITNERIELFGLPGAGKTYYANHMYNEFFNMNTELNSRNRLSRFVTKLLKTAKILLFHTNIFFESIKFLGNIEFKSLKNKIKMILYNFSILDLIYESKRIKGSIILDEGMLQVLWAICYNSKMEYQKIIKDFFDLYDGYILENVYYIKGDINIIMERLLSRQNSGGSELEHEIKENPKEIERANEIVEEIIKYMSDKRKIKFVEVQ